MDRFILKSSYLRFGIACLFGNFLGCVANPVPVTTVWDKLGIPQAAAGARDALINRTGRFPKLEKKPPLLKIADPANLKPEKPEVIKTAAKIKAEQDMKKQKIKAIKYLAEINCGCYNKDGAVAKAFLEALNDCDPDVRMAAIEGISTTIGNCSSCRNRCQPSCCSLEVHKKLQDVAHGKDDQGCWKEPSAEIRKLAAAVVCKCPCPQANPVEEIPAPAAVEIEELVAPEADVEGKRLEKKPEGTRPEGANKEGAGDSARYRFTDGVIEGVSYRQSENEWGSGDEPVMIAEHRNAAADEVASDEVPASTMQKTTASTTAAMIPASLSSSTKSKIANPDQLITARVISNREAMGELLIELNEVYQVSKGWTMVVVDGVSNHHVSRVAETSGRRILLTTELADHVEAVPGQTLRIGLVKH